MPHIDAYSFGRMVIDGQTYTKDLIIFPGSRGFSPWWRISGHRLAAADLTDLLAANPGTIIAGTGASGLMRPEPDLVRLLEQKGIEFMAMPTADAVEEYNRRADAGTAAACFHLTC